ncbi:hypothetical protein Tco_0545432 [Tanacetum coccineum]
MIAINQIGHGEGSAISAGSQHTPLMAPETIRQEVEVPHSNFPNETPVADEAPFIGVDVVHGGAAATVSSIDACGKLVGRIEANKITYGAAFTKLIKKVKKLEQTVKTSQAKRRANIVVSDDEDNEEDPSKQGRSMIEEMDLDARISLVPPHVEVQRRYGQNLETQEGFGYGQEVSTAVQVSTAGPEATTPDAELNTAKTLMEIKKSAAKAKGKANMDETESLRKREQLQAGEKCSEEDLPMKLIELVNQRKKFFAQQRAKAKRNKPMTHAQQKEYIYQITSRTKKERLKRAGQEVLEEPIKRQKIGEASGLDNDDTLWKLQRISIDKGIMTVMLVNKLQVDQYSEMANELLRKIFYQANRLTDFCNALSFHGGRKVTDNDGQVASRGWSFASAVPGQMTHLVANSTLDSANSCVM